MSQIKYFSVFLGLVLLATGCTRRVNVTSNTFANQKLIPQGFPEGASFLISPKEEYSSSSLFLQEVEDKIAQRLESNHYIVTDDAKNAEYHFIYTCSVVASKKTIQVPHFIPGSQQVKNGVEYSHVSGNAHSGYDSIHMSGIGSTNYHETTTSSGSIVYLPKTITIFTHKIDVEVYRTKFFVLGKNTELVWQGAAVSCELTGDQRDILDYLLNAIFSHFGDSTDKNMCESYSK